SRTSESSTVWPASSTDRRICIWPGFAANTTRDGPVGVPADAVGATEGTRPRKYGEPSSPAARTFTRDGMSPLRAVDTPAVRGTASHTRVTFVRPSGARSGPIQVRMTRTRVGWLIAASADSTAFGGPGFVGFAIDSARAASAFVIAQ